MTNEPSKMEMEILYRLWRGEISGNNAERLLKKIKMFQKISKGEK